MRWFISILGLLLLVVAPATASRPSFETEAPVAYMVDMASGAVLIDENSRRSIPPASMTKMMTAYVTFELIASGKLQSDTQFTVRPETWKAWNNTGSTMFLKPGEKVRVSDLLHGVITLSGNDASIVLAEGIAGSEAEFVNQMNKSARRLGMNDSFFGTANGWPDNGRTRSTAHDLAELAVRTLRDYPKLYRQYYGLPSFRWNNVTQTNRNPLLGKIDGADGIKTGHTNEAGYCFTGTAAQKGRRLVLVVAGLPSTAARAAESIEMMNWGFTAWRAKPLFAANEIATRIPVQLGIDSSVAVMAPRELALTLPAKVASRYMLFVRFNGPIKAPVKKGAEVAKLVAKFDDGTEQVMPLIAATSVGRAGYLGRVWNGLKYLVGA